MAATGEREEIPRTTPVPGMSNAARSSLKLYGSGFVERHQSYIPKISPDDISHSIRFTKWVNTIIYGVLLAMKKKENGTEKYMKQRGRDMKCPLLPKNDNLLNKSSFCFTLTYA